MPAKMILEVERHLPIGELEKVGRRTPSESGGGLWTLNLPVDGLGGAPVNNVENLFIPSGVQEIWNRS